MTDAISFTLLQPENGQHTLIRCRHGGRTRVLTVPDAKHILTTKADAMHTEVYQGLQEAVDLAWILYRR